jgi:ectoine hydroxylase-related dioxygenase (phytanoyl-CoA dioxygenase family)
MMDTGFLEKDSGTFSKLWGRRWVAADYGAGDVVLHDPYNIHCSAVNETEVIRLATDLRFVETGKPFDQRRMKTGSVSVFTPDRCQTADLADSLMMDCNGYKPID